MPNQSDEFKLSKEGKAEMIGQIRDFFLKERGEDIGDLAADIVLDFIVEKMALKFYNKGIDDAYAYMTDRIPDLLSLQKVK